MAAIDKTYVKTWEEYTQVKDFVNKFGKIEDKYGNIFYPLEFLIEWEESEFKESIQAQKERYKKYYEDPKHIEEERQWRGSNWKPDVEGVGELPIWNTPLYFDLWLMRECGVKFIQDRLREQYDGEFIREVIEERSIYDLYVKPAEGTHFKILTLTRIPRRLRRGWWRFQVEGSSDWMFDDESWKWYNWQEAHGWNTNTASIYGLFGEGMIKRVQKKWGFPAGVVLSVFGMGYRMRVVIKK